MSFLVGILMLALTRAEIIERVRAAPATQAEGLVCVYADCPSDMRREYQLPVASFVSDICRRLYGARRMRPIRFQSPGIIVRIGESTDSTMTNVYVRVIEGDKGRQTTRIILPAPGYADRQALRIETVKGFYRAVLGEEIDDNAAVASLRSAIPELRINDEYAQLDEILNGEMSVNDVEEQIKLLRKIIEPGKARPIDIRLFASRLFLYPQYLDMPFCGRYDYCSFEDAIQLAALDPYVRLAAYYKAREIIVFGGGKGEALSDAAVAYSEFLVELAKLKKSPVELENLLLEAEDKLKGVGK